MKLLAIGAAALLLGGMAYAGMGGGEANVYSLPITEAHERLANAPLGQRGRAPFADFETSIAVEGPDRIVYEATNAHARHRCELSLTALESARTRIDVSCAGGSASDGLAVGSGPRFARSAVIELVDATLTGRPYDRELARGATASWWPEDVRPAPGIREVVGGG